MDSIGQISQYPPLIYRPDQTQNQAAKTGVYSSLSQMEKISVWESQETDLSIVTQEGDYVTISADSEFRLDFTTYDQTGRMKGYISRLHSESLSLDGSQEFSISVDGELNEQEIKDIRKVLQSLDKIIKDLLSGKLDQGTTGTEKLGDLGSLSSIEATLQVEQSISGEKTILAETIASPPPSDQAEVSEKPIGPNALAIAQRRMVDTLRDGDFSPDKLSRIIEKFFLKLSRVLSENGHHNLVREGSINRLRNVLLKGIGPRHS
jgi:hypothetical protein